ncbi:MAG: hypothetical protein GF344_19320 [Chitinivibrionales bacterium]|nr:hypothetical protein [Chitinivibrionales bacterium]
MPASDHAEKDWNPNVFAVSQGNSGYPTALLTWFRKYLIGRRKDGKSIQI